MKSSYERRANDEDEKRGATPNNDDEGSDAKSDSSSDSSNSDRDMVMVTVTVTMIVRVITMKTMIANIVAMIGVNPQVIEKMKIRGITMKSMMMM